MNVCWIELWGVDADSHKTESGHTILKSINLLCIMGVLVPDCSVSQVAFRSVLTHEVDRLWVRSSTCRPYMLSEPRVGQHVYLTDESDDMDLSDN